MAVINNRESKTNILLGWGINSEVIIVSKRFLVTRASNIAHITRDMYNKFDVILGAYEVMDENAVKRKIADIRIHRNYQFARLPHNVALIQLDSEFIDTEFLKPISLELTEDAYKHVDGKTYTVYGFCLDSVSFF